MLKIDEMSGSNLQFLWPNNDHQNSRYRPDCCACCVKFSNSGCDNFWGTVVAVDSKEVMFCQSQVSQPAGGELSLAMFLPGLAPHL